MSFYEYLNAFWSHWVVYMTAGPFALERIAKQFWNGYESWIRQYLSSERRFRIGATAAILGVFVAGFQVFQDEREKLQGAEASLAALQKPYYIPDSAITDDQIAKLRSALAPLPKFTVAIFFVSEDRISVANSKKLYDLLRTTETSATRLPGWVEDENDVGLQLIVKNKDHLSDNEAAYVNAFRSSGLDCRVVSPLPGQEAPLDLQIFAGPKKMMLP